MNPSPLDSTHRLKDYHLTPEGMEQDVENMSVLINMDEAERERGRQRETERDS